MADKSWKAFERTVARFFGCCRNSLSGIMSKLTASDTVHERLFIECKHGQKIPAWSLFQKTRELAKKEGKIPVLALRKTGAKTWLVICEADNLSDVADEITAPATLPYRKETV